MKVLLAFLFVISSISAATRLLNLNELETLFKKFVLNNLTEEEKGLLTDALEILQRPESLSTKSLENSSQLRVTIDCLICRSAFSALFDGVNAGQSDEHLSDTLTTLCVSLGIENYNVCSGAVALNIPILAYVIRNTPEAHPNTFCSLILQNAGNPNVCPHQDRRFEWHVELPEKADTVPTPVYDGKPLKLAIISDAHVDPLYEPNGVADCDEPTCCRKGQRITAKSFSHETNIDESLLQESLIEENGEKMLNLSMVDKIRQQKRESRSMYKTRNSAPAGYWGDYRRCDTPLWAYDDAIETIKENHKDIDLLYYIGDTIDHGIWETSYELINNMNRYMIQKIKNTFGEGLPVVPAIGNHEAQPTNQFAPSSITEPKLNTTWLYKGLAEKWDKYLSEEAKANLIDHGDFSVVVKPGLRVISINNNIAYTDNWWLVYDPVEPKRHLDWLIQELTKAELNGEKVHILAHIPPGVHDLIHSWTREYNRIVKRFSSTIAAEFNGHTHSDEFKIFYDDNDSPINMAWGGGSITSYSFYNLNYKIVNINGDSLIPDNIVNYVYNLTEANLTPNRRPHWFMLYDIRNSFGLTDLSAKSMNDLVYGMVRNQRSFLDLYNAYYSKLSDERWQSCNNNCKIDNLCKTVVTVLWERQRCNELRDIFFS